MVFKMIGVYCAILAMVMVTSESKYIFIPGVCRQPVAPGTCKARVPSWYYNQEQSRCVSFMYGGCGGNDNRFSSRELCERHCDQLQKPVPEVCRQPRQVGPCKARVPSWYYNQEKSKCVLFMYGGCGGNDNNFESRELCERQCDQHL